MTAWGMIRMPSGANSNQMHAKYASINRGTIHYGAARSRGPRADEKTWSEETGVDLDRLLDEERVFIARMRRRTRCELMEKSDMEKPDLQLVYETLSILRASGVTPSCRKVAERLDIRLSAVKRDIGRLVDMGLVVHARTRRGGYRVTGKVPDWEEVAV